MNFLYRRDDAGNYILYAVRWKHDRGPADVSFSCADHPPLYYVNDCGNLVVGEDTTGHLPNEPLQFTPDRKAHAFIYVFFVLSTVLHFPSFPALGGCINNNFSGFCFQILFTNLTIYYLIP